MGNTARAKRDACMEEEEEEVSDVGHWNHGLCECGVVPWSVCCISGCWCQPCQVAKLNSYVLGDQPPRVCSFLPAMIAGPLSIIFPITPWIQSCVVRAAVRDELNIPESSCETCLIATLLSGSSTTQITMTLAKQKHVPAYVFMDD